MTILMLEGLTMIAAPLLALVLVYSGLGHRLQQRERAVECLFGVLFGATAVFGMLYPFTLESGLIFDGRSVVLSLAGFIGGPVVAGISMLMAASYRLWLGGTGTWVGLAVIASAAMIGAAAYPFRRQVRLHAGALTFLALGILVHAVAVLLMLLLPTAQRTVVNEDVTWPFALTLTLLTWVFGYTFQLVESRAEALSNAKESEERFRHLVEGALVGVYLMQKGRLAYANPSLERTFGYRPGMMVGLAINDVVAADDVPHVTELFRASTATGLDIVRHRFQARHADGHHFPVEAFGSHVQRDGQRTLMGMLVDLTQHHQAEQDLARELNNTRNMLNTMTDGYICADLRGNILDTNPAYCRMLGYERDALIGRNVNEFRVDDPAITGPARVQQIIDHGHLRYQTRHRHRDGHIVDFEAAAAYLPQAEPPQLTNFLRDVTQEKIVSARYQELVNRVPAGVFRYRTQKQEGRFEYVSPRFCALLEIDQQTALTDTAWLSERIAAEDMTPFSDLRKQAKDQHRPFVWEGCLNLPSGRRWVLVEADCTVETQEVLLWHGIVSDVSERQQLLQQQRLDSEVIESTFESIMVTELDGTLVSVNPAFTRATGYSADEVIGQKPRLLQSGRHEVSFYKEMFRALEEVGHWRGQIWNRRKSGELYPDLLNISVVRDANGHPTHYVGVASDISELKRSEAKLQQLAHHDALTGLPNRRWLESHLLHAIELAQGRGDALAVLFLDLDRFNLVNDSLGHSIGDLLLVAVAERLIGVLGAEGTLGRLGGDEFLVLIEHKGDADRAARVTEALLDAFSEPFALSSGHDFYLQVSIGVSQFPADGDRPELLIRNADSAMYRAKEQGGNSCQFYTEALTEAARERLDIETKLRRGIENDEFQVWYQPIYRIADRRMVGAEALARWWPADGDMITPDRFIPVAEDSGLIATLGRQILTKSCRDLRVWLDQGLPIECLAVNLSAQQFLDPNFVTSVAELIADAGVPPQLIELEITERRLLELGDRTFAQLHALRALGVSLSIDDFGTGYSSLNYLRQMPMDKVKIDRSFVKDLPNVASDAAIIHAILAVAQSLNLRVLAEGVETQDQLDFLASAGCDECQGFYFGRAVPADQFAEQMRRQ
ncbi:EAL domain-containing protein [Polycyclovorans algicola]|uniref:EAL domain-containing protein n=1 Tax=Polycyclovorans algicola TaxID=616992 RepID=UPI000A041E03|nr:EAL domain-containing protein [Polycyclovorans algicola]